MARALVAWYRGARRDLPWRRSRDPYRVHVAEIMLQQTTVRAVVPCYARFLERFPDVRSLAAAPLPAVLAAWSGLGYYRRARHLHAAARRIVRDHGARFPPRLDEALALPGVGRYTAGAVLSIAYGAPLPIVDGNVTRVLSRLHLWRGAAARPAALWRGAEALVAVAAAPGDLNQALMELGATVCLPAAPACNRCPVRSWCRARAAGLEERVPAPRRRRPTVRLRHEVALVRRRGRYLMRRRRGSGLMDGLWEFPPLDDADLGPRLQDVRHVATVRHTITYRLIDVAVHEASLPGPTSRGHRWVAPEGMAALPTSSLVGKVLRAAAAAAPGAARRPGEARRSRV